MSRDIGLSFLSDRPFLSVRSYSKVFENKLKIILRKDFDFVFFEGLQMSQYVDFVKHSVTVLDLHNPEHVLLRNMYDSENNRLKKAFLKVQLDKLRSYELSQVKRFDKVFTVSDTDAVAVGMANFYNGFVVPNGCTVYDIDFIFKPGLLYVGSLDYSPNEDGLLWFLDNVFPKVKEEFPDIVFQIIGKNPSARVKAFASDNVKVLGYVEDLVPYYNKASLFVVPLKISGGQRMKIVEAMGFKKCVVSTTIGVDSLAVEDNKEVFLADDAITFANRIIGLLKNPSIMKDAAENAYSLVKEKYDWKDIVRKVEDILESR